MKIYSIYKKIIMMLIINLFIFIGKIEAVQITSFTEFTLGEESLMCTSQTNVCATDISSSGFRVTMIDGNGNKVSGTQTVNFWPTAEMSNYSKTKEDDDRPFNTLCSDPYNFNLKKSETNTYEDVYDFDIGIYDGETERLYKKYFENIKSNKITKIVEYLITDKTKSITDYTTYYLKVEPIYMIREKSWSVCGFYAGTSKEILDIWQNKIGTTKTYPAYGEYYKSGGCNSYISGHWNPIRNYIVSMYYSCETKEKGEGPQGVACYDLKKYGSLQNYKSIRDGSKCKNNVGELNNLYKNGNGLGVGYFKISDYVDSCQSKATDLIGKKEALTKLYLDELLKGNDYRNLLNFDDPKCTTKNDCSYSSSVGCFKGNAGVIQNEGDNVDLSCYNHTITANSEQSDMPVTGYCNVTSNITNLLGSDSFSGTPGRLLIKAFEFSRVQLQFTCTFPEIVKTSTFSKLNFSDFLSFKVDEESINVLDDSLDFSMENSNFYQITFNSSLTFSTKYAKNVSGKIERDICSNCKRIGEGYITRLNQESGQIEFSYKFETNETEIEEKTGTCPYVLTPELVKKIKLTGNGLGEENIEKTELDIVIRSVDPNVYYFSTVDGTKRKLGKNWSFDKTDEEMDFNKDGIVDGDDESEFEEIINSRGYLPKYDINKDGMLDFYDENEFFAIISNGVYLLEYDMNNDGTLDYNDGDLFRTIINSRKYSIEYDMNKDGVLNGTDVEFVKQRIEKKEGYEYLLLEYVFENTNNSFDKDQVGPKYRIELTKEDIESIRNYNDTNPYDDYNMECVEGVDCYSNFFNLYNIEKINIEHVQELG